MLKRLHPPQCSLCTRGSHAALYESALWGIVCADCQQVLTKWCVKHNLIEANPLIESLLLTDQSQWRGDSFGATYQVSGSTFVTVWFPRFINFFSETP